MTPARDREALEQAIARGSELLKQGKLGDAQRAFRVALEIDGESVRVLALLGLSYFRAGEFEAARPIYEELVERAPTDAAHRLNLGLVYLKVNDAEHAITALEASRALDPSQGRAVSYLGLAYARAGRYAEAYRSFLLAGQHELATEIETNLTAAERDGINAHLGRTPTPPYGRPTQPLPAELEVPVRATPPPAPRPAHSRIPTPPPDDAVPSLPRTITHASSAAAGEPRTKPPSAPPKGKRSKSDPSVAEVHGEFSQPESRVERSEIVAEITREQADAAAVPTDGQSMVSKAINTAEPSRVVATRTPAGGILPQPLSELATDSLVRPDEGTDLFEISGGGTLLIRVAERVMTRLTGVHVTGGDLAYEPAMRRSRGQQSEEPFEGLGMSMHVVTGKGYLIAAPGKHTFHAVVLDDDILYVREDLLFAFESSLRWENGNVPGLRGKLHVVQFRGDGALVLRLARPLVRVKLPPHGLVFVDADRLAGWIGRVIPRAVVPPSGGPLGAMCVECTGEGIVLVEPVPDDRAQLDDTAPHDAEPQPAAPYAEAEIDLDADHRDEI